MQSKYIKLHSLTWWASVTPLIAGAFVASEPMHGLSTIVMTVDNMTGGLSPAVLINAGLAGIGLRGAMG